MVVALFTHSLLSDWNHGNAHFLRGIVVELQVRGFEVRVFEPLDAWSAANLVADHGPEALEATRTAYPELHVTRYDMDRLDLDRALDGVSLVLVHEWSSHELVQRIGGHRRRSGGYTLLFHDTHHRSITDGAQMGAYDLSGYDGVLAFGEVIRRRYLDAGWARHAWTWHEAADVRVFHPFPEIVPDRDLVWIGNWGDDERTHELEEFLIGPAERLRLRADVYGVRYPPEALARLSAAGIQYRGWLPNYLVPRTLALYKVAVHVPRRPYAQRLAGVPTIRPFEALACGVPLVCAPWEDVEDLFRPGIDYLVARNGAEMERCLRDVLENPPLARELAARGLETIRARHTCRHRVDELLGIWTEIQAASTERPVAV